MLALKLNLDQIRLTQAKRLGSFRCRLRGEHNGQILGLLSIKEANPIKQPKRPRQKMWHSPITNKSLTVWFPYKGNTTKTDRLSRSPELPSWRD